MVDSVSKNALPIHEAAHRYISYDYLPKPSDHKGAVSTQKITPSGSTSYNRLRERGATNLGVNKVMEQIAVLYQGTETSAPSSADIASADQLSNVPPSDTYEADVGKLNDMKYGFLGDVVKNVSRDFVSPDSINHLDQLAPEQKAAMLYELVQIKSEFNAYMHRYGDNADNAANAKKSIDSRIERLMGDKPTQDFIAAKLAEKFKAYLQKPENDVLLGNLKMDYISDISGGKAIDRALAAGKSFADALSDFFKEFQTLSQLLPEKFINDGIGAANVSLARAIEKHMFSNADVPASIDQFVKGGSKEASALAPVIEMLTNNFAAQNIPNLSVNLVTLKQDFARDITNAFNSVVRLIRGGMKLNDAFDSYYRFINKANIPAGVDGDMYKAGLFHGVQMLTMSASLVAKGIGTGGNWAATDISAALASGVQIAGMTVEGMAKNLSVAGKPFSIFGTENGSWGQQINNRFSVKDIEAGGKIIGSVGGLAAAGLTFFSASRSFKDGDKAAGALQTVAGVAGFASAMSGFAEAALHLTGAVGKYLMPPGTAASIVAEAEAIMKNFFAVTGLVAGTVLSAISVALGIMDMANGAKALDKMEKNLDKKLEKYTGEQVHFSFGPDPDFTW